MKNEHGFAPIFILLAIIGVAGFLVVFQLAPLNKGNLSKLSEKPSSYAAGEVFAIIGDSASDEYRADDNRAGSSAYAAVTLNWMEQLVRNRGFNFGPWSDTSRGEPRRRGYEYNFARSGARVADVLSNNQHTSVRDLISQGKVTHVYIQIGANDAAEWNNTYQDIYNGVISGTALTNKQNAMVSGYTTILDTVKSGGNAKIVIATMPDLNTDPSVVARYPDATKRQRITTFVNNVNTSLKSIAQARNVPVFDMLAFFMSDVAPRVSGVNMVVGGQNIAMNSVGDEPHHMIIGDGIHSGTVTNGLVANGIMRMFNTNHGTNFQEFTDQQILVAAGLAQAPASPSPSPTQNPTALPSGSGQQTLIFDDLGVIHLNGVIPTGLIDWGNWQWHTYAPFGLFTTVNFTYNAPNITSAPITFVNPKILVSLDAYDENGTNTVTLACGSNPTRTFNLVGFKIEKLVTNWIQPCTTLTVTSTKGWSTNFDNMVIANSVGTNPSTAPSPSVAPSVNPSPIVSPSPTPAPSVKPGDIDGNGRVDIFDYNTIVTNFGKTGTNIAGDLDKNGRVDIFDYNTLVTNFGN